MLKLLDSKRCKDCDETISVTINYKQFIDNRDDCFGFTRDGIRVTVADDITSNTRIVYWCTTSM